MGGEHEDRLETTKAFKQPLGDVLTPEIEAQVASTGARKVGELEQPIRYHVSGGEVHFHVDQEGLKVAVPVAEWWSAWEQLKSLRIERWRYVDHQEGCLLQVEAGSDKKGRFEVVPKVTKIADGTGPIFEKLDAFTNKQRKKKK